MACIGDILHRLIWMKSISMLSLYVQSGTHRHFQWIIMTVLTQKSYCSDVCEYHLCPQTLAKICKNMGFCWSFRAVAANKNIRGSFITAMVSIYFSPGILQSHHHAEGYVPWWRHQMETFSASLAICAGNSPVPVNSLHKGQWRGALMFPLIFA